MIAKPTQFIEHDNRQKANQFAEFITGEALCQLMAEKVRHYLGGDPISVIDGAAGSGQLQRFLALKDFFAIDVQPASLHALKANFPAAHATCSSFFTYQHPHELADCAVMNPPFSFKYKDLTSAEKSAIAQDFPWKKSGAVDDIFLLKALSLARRFGFFIQIPGIAYRNTEKKLRQIIGTQLAECNVIAGGFEHTTIDTLLLVIDKEKSSKEYLSSHIDLKSGKQLTERFNIGEDGAPWELAKPAQELAPPVDIAALNSEILTSVAQGLRQQLAIDSEMAGLTGIDFVAHCQNLIDVINQARADFIARQTLTQKTTR